MTLKSASLDAFFIVAARVMDKTNKEVKVTYSVAQCNSPLKFFGWVNEINQCQMCRYWSLMIRVHYRITILCLLLVLLLTSFCYLHYRITILAYCIVINEYYHLLWLFKNEWMNGCILCYSFPGLVFVDFFRKKSGFAAFLLLFFFSEWMHCTDDMSSVF